VKIKIIPLEKRAWSRTLADGIEIPLHHFFRQHGRCAAGKRWPLQQRTAWIMAAISITRIWSPEPRSTLPVHAKGALFEVGDGHADKATAKWISPRSNFAGGTFHLRCEKACIKWPAAETPTHYITWASTTI